MEHYGFPCACRRCKVAHDVHKELDYTDRYDALRCAHDDCGSGLGVRPYEGGSGGHGGDGGGAGDEGVLRCVHCGREWEAG